MNKLDKDLIKKYKKILFGTLFIMYAGYISLSYVYNEHLIKNGHDVVFDYSFPILALSIMFIATIIFKMFEDFNKD